MTTTTIQLGPRAQKVLQFIAAHGDQFGPPRLTDIALAMGTHKRTAHSHVVKLTKKGLLHPNAGLRGAIALTAKGREAFNACTPLVTMTSIGGPDGADKH